MTSAITSLASTQNQYGSFFRVLIFSFCPGWIEFLKSSRLYLKQCPSHPRTLWFRPVPRWDDPVSDSWVDLSYGKFWSMHPTAGVTGKRGIWRTKLPNAESAVGAESQKVRRNARTCPVDAVLGGGLRLLCLFIWQIPTRNDLAADS